MLFSSITFLYYFLPIVIILYAVAPRKLKNTVILISSFVFYGWGEPRFLLLMLSTILVGYGLGLLMEITRSKAAKNLLVAFLVVISLGMLGYFKYADFFITTINSISGGNISLLHIALPIGISFYTFQMMSYVIDVYRGDVKAQKNIINLAAYITMFPQLIAGPIVRYKDIELSLVSRIHSINKISDGIRRFAIGLGKKVLIANTLGMLVAGYKITEAPSVLYVWLYAISASLQIYFDFSGYSDMAIGLGKLMGFDFPENFNYPYISGSVTEFWRRWHMTLGGWFRDYLYIPLGGNRVSKVRWIFNIFVVWMATGLWHGASWNFVIWGLYFAVLLMFEKLILLKYLDKTRVVGHIYLLLLVVVSFVIFDGADLSESVNNIKMMFGLGQIPVWTDESIFMLFNYGFVIILAIVGASGFPAVLMHKLVSDKTIARYVNVLEPVFIGFLLIVCTGFLVNGSFNPFLYFRF